MYLRRYFSEWYLYSKVWTLRVFQEQKRCCETTVCILFILYSDYNLCAPYSTETNPIGTAHLFSDIQKYMQNFCA